MDFSAKQLRAGRALLKISQGELHQATGVAQSSLSAFEKGESELKAKNKDVLLRYLDHQGLEFIPGGVREKPQSMVKELSGHEGFIEFMDDVYNTVRLYGGQVCVANVNEDNWLRWMGKKKYTAHEKRMQALEQCHVKILVQEGDENLLAPYGEYRCMSKDHFNVQSFYSYGSKLAIIAFEDANVHITIIHQKAAVEGFQAMFSIAWEQAQRV